MKKFLLFLLMLPLLFVTSCGNKYEAEAGKYELYYMDGSFQLSSYEYYTITLYANGKCDIASKATSNPTKYEASGKFDIVDGKINIYTSYGLAQTVTETYDYINGEIHMLNVKVENYEFTAKFRRALEPAE